MAVTATVTIAIICPHCNGRLAPSDAGEGVHVYDLAHRLFESEYSKTYSALAVRRLRLRDPCERNTARTEHARDFVATVRMP